MTSDEILRNYINGNKSDAARGIREYKGGTAECIATCYVICEIHGIRRTEFMGWILNRALEVGDV